MLEEIFDNKELVPKFVAIFIFILIISGNYLGELFPCKVQDLFQHNIYVKHFLGYVTLVFFVTLTVPELKKSTKLLSSSILLYCTFLILTNTYHTYWLYSFFMLGVIYLIDIYAENIKHNDKEKKYNIFIENAEFIKKIIMMSIIVSIIIGFFVYLGLKKIEYGKKFDYITFIFGKPSCRGLSPDVSSYSKIFAALFK